MNNFTKETERGSWVRRRKLGIASLADARNSLTKRLSVSRQLLAASHLWAHAIPCPNCDIIVTLPPSSPQEVLVWIVNVLRTRSPDLIVDIHQYPHTRIFGLQVTTTYDSLLQGAEDLNLRKQLTEEYGGGLKQFLYEERMCFRDVNDQDRFLTTQERQRILLNILNNLRAVEGDHLRHVKFVEGQSIVPKCLSEGIILHILPLHNKSDLTVLKNTWVRMQAFLKRQPLDDICHYFGVKIAIYFAWLGHYTGALTFPAIFGLILWISFYGRDQATEDLCFVIFALFNILWATLYMESWKRYCAELAYRWGTLDSQSQLLAEPRPLFTGPLVRSPVTGRLEPSYPMWKRNLFRYCVSLPVIVLCLLVVFIVMFLIFELQTWCDEQIALLNYPFWLTYAPKVLLALVINVMDGIYHRIACWLNNKENYRLEEEYENHLIVKVLLFQFVNSFLALFYVAFYLQDMEKLKEHLAALLITRQLVGNIRESVIPFLVETLTLAHMQSKPANGRVCQLCETNNCTCKKDEDITQAEVESIMYKYDGTFDDYLEMFIQFGYVILFSSAFPMAGLCALINNIIEIRSDAFKLCYIVQRPFGQQAENIGSWQDAMEVLCVIAVIVNCALIGMSGQIHRMFPDMSLAGNVILIIVLEHIILSVKFGIAYAIPDIPEWVATEMAKVEFHRREVAKRIQSASSSQLAGCRRHSTKKDASTNTTVFPLH